jgi:hypothetical protein
MRFCVPAALVLLLAMACQTGRPPVGVASPPGAPTLAPAVPSDLPAGATSDDAAVYAWQSFVALNWPALTGQRGVPDRTRTIGQPGDVVWHTWKAPEEVFYPDGRQPPPWQEYGGMLPPECAAAGARAGDYLLRRTAKADTTASLVESIEEAVGGTLTDQHGNLARFDIRMNQPMFAAIVAGAYYNQEGQDAAPYISFPSGVMEIKAAWREMTAGDPPAVRARFFRRPAWIFTPPLGPDPATCAKGELGLVGLHITQKTPSRRQWTWATFEHVDNVPPGVNGWPGPFSFNDPGCSPQDCPPNQSTEQNGVPTGRPTQVTRFVPIGPAAAAANPVWQQALRAAVPGSPFQFYQLVDIQWPQTPAQPPFGNPTPELVANTTMETYVAQSSCLNCHYTAQTASGKLSADFSFLLSEAAPRAGKAAQ